MATDKRESRILAATDILGSGFMEASLLKGLEWQPDFIGTDSGTTDPGPYCLGSGKAQFSQRAYARDLRILLHEAVPRRIPLVIGSAATSGANPHVDYLVGIVRDLATELGLHFKLAVVRSEVDKGWLKSRLQADKKQLHLLGESLYTYERDQASDGLPQSGTLSAEPRHEKSHQGGVVPDQTGLSVSFSV